MKPRELPIIFTAESVRAILSGAKTQTRRIINPQPHQKTTLIEWNDADRAWIPWDWGFGTGVRMTGDPIRSRFRVGDVLWVKEAWRTEELPTGESGIRFRADDSFRVIENTKAASEAWLSAHIRGNPFAAALRRGNAWRSPLYMPRWASRVAREVTEVRAQRVQAISEEDAVAEGFAGSEVETPREQFATAWDRINGTRSPWARNDFVFAYTFRRIER